MYRKNKKPVDRLRFIGSLRGVYAEQSEVLAMTLELINDE